MNIIHLKKYINECAGSFIYSCEHHTAPMYIISDVIEGFADNAVTISLIKWNNFDDTQWSENTICGGNVKALTTVDSVIAKLNEFDDSFDNYDVFAYYGEEDFEVCGFEDSTNCGWDEIRLGKI